jgi:hypothetical protein
MGAKHQFRDIKLNPAYTAEERAAIAQELIRYIKDRSSEGKGPGGKAFSGSYSKEYKDSIEYKIARKDGTINQKLSGDMLDSIDILGNDPGRVRYGFEQGTDENAKADGNIRGTYGQSRPIPGKARDFLTLTSSEVQAVLAKYPLDDNASRGLRTAIQTASSQVAESFGAALFGESDE